MKALWNHLQNCSIDELILTIIVAAIVFGMIKAIVTD